MSKGGARNAPAPVRLAQDIGVWNKDLVEEHLVEVRLAVDLP